MIVVVASATPSTANGTTSAMAGRLDARAAHATRGMAANSVTVASCEYMAAAAQAAQAQNARRPCGSRATVSAKWSASRYQSAANAVVTAHTHTTASTYDGITTKIAAEARARSLRPNTRAVRNSTRTPLAMC